MHEEGVGPKVYVDYREKKLIRILAEFAEVTEVLPMPVGDLAIVGGDGCALVERKTPHDLVGSMVDNRIWNQMHRISAAEEFMGAKIKRKMLVIDGDLSEQVELGRVAWSQVYGLLQEVTFVYGVPVFTVRCGFEDFIRTLYAREVGGKNDREGEFRLRKLQPHYVDDEDWKVYMLSSIPGIGDKLARGLLEHFGSIKRIAEADVGELMRVEGIGRKKAERIRKIFS